MRETCGGDSFLKMWGEMLVWSINCVFALSPYRVDIAIVSLKLTYELNSFPFCLYIFMPCSVTYSMGLLGL